MDRGQIPDSNAIQNSDAGHRYGTCAEFGDYSSRGPQANVAISRLTLDR